MLQTVGSIVLVVLAANCLPNSAMAQARVDVPILMGGANDGLPQCSVGQIVGLDPKGDGFLSVRSGPGGRQYREIDRLHNGQEVFMCDQQGPWTAVVYRRGARAASPDCQVFPLPRVRRAYAGPCDYGWVHQRYVRVIAG